MDFGHGAWIRITCTVIHNPDIRNSFTRILLCAVLLFVSIYVYGKIRNGHEVRFRHAQDSLPILRHRLATAVGLTFWEKQSLKVRIAELSEIAIYHELTNNLLDRMRAISPELYLEMDELKDRRGRPTDIFVRLIPKQSTRVPFVAASILSNSRSDRDAACSEHGLHSVAVDLWLSERAPLMLSHELGHLSYIVPNLSTYSQFYRKHYGPETRFTRIGHLMEDLSGKQAKAFEKRYLADYRAYIAESGRPPSMLSEMSRIRRSMRDWPSPTPVPPLWHDLDEITTTR